MVKNIIIAVLILIILAGLVYWQFELKDKQPAIIETPIPMIIETPEPTPTPTPQVFNYYHEQSIVYVTPEPTLDPYWIPCTPKPTIDPYWIPGPWGEYNYN